MRPDERDGEIYYTDRSGQGNHAACASGVPNCPTAGVAGRADHALQFHGNEVVRVADHPSLNFAGGKSFSLQAWVRPASSGARVLAKGVGPSAYELRVGAEGQAELWLYDATFEAARVSGGPNLLDQQWHYLVATVDVAAGQAHLYVDGVLQDSQPFLGPILANPGDLSIGGVFGDANLAFSGSMDEVAIFAHALSTAEVQALYQAADRQWLPAPLAQHGAGITTTTWSLVVPAGLEGQYQLDLRGADMLGNSNVTSSVWRGVIDTLAPRVVMSGTPTGATYLDQAGVRHYAVAYVCAAQDLHLSEADFVCPGSNLPPPTQSFDDDPILQHLFPDLAIRDSLAIAYTQWETTTQISRTMHACDVLGHCATATAQLTLTPPVGGGGPQAMVVAPGAESTVAATGSISVTVVAAGQALKDITLSLDGNVVNTATFAQQDAITQNQRTIAVIPGAEGQHTLVARASDWAGTIQTNLFPVTFTLDIQPPTVTISTSLVTVQDTYQLGSGILRFHGTAHDTLCLAAVKVRVDNGPWADASFDNNTWRIAYPVNAPEGRTLAVTAQAQDCAGRTTTVTRNIGTDLSSPDAPDTRITSHPSNPSSPGRVTFGFNGIKGANELVGFACQLDNGPYTPCASPWSYSNLADGVHTFRARAVDANGFVDVTPASFTWTVLATAQESTIYLPWVRR